MATIEFQAQWVDRLASGKRGGVTAASCSVWLPVTYASRCIRQDGIHAASVVRATRRMRKDTCMIRRLGVIGDLHAEDRRLDRVLDWLVGAGVDAIICTGDIADGRGCVDVTCRLLREARAIVVAGNHDRWLLQGRVRHVPEAHLREALAEVSIDYLSGLSRATELETVAGRLLLCHGVGENDLGKVWPGTPRSPIERSVELDALIGSGRYRFLVNGHLHYRVLIDFEDLLLMNAGTLKGAHGGFSIMDFANDSVIAFALDDNDSPRRLVEHPLRPVGDRRVWRDTQDFDGTWQPLALYG
jgi:putative phosphoesterase